MPNLSYQMQLVNAMQERPMQNLDTLLNTAGGVFQRSEARTDEQDAINYFSQKESITPEDLQDFSANHPRMPVVDVWKYAGAIGTQKKAQRLKDQFKTIQGAMKSAYDNGKEFDMAQVATLFPNGIEPELVQRLKEYKSLYPEAKILEMEPGKVYQRTIGGKPIGDPMRGPEKPIEQKYKIGEMIDNITGPDGELYQGWVGGYDENGQVKFDRLVKKVEKTEKDKTPLSQAFNEKLTEIDPATGKNYTRSAAYKAVTAQTPSAAHDTILIKDAEGKKERRMQFNPETSRYDIPASEWAPVTSQVISITKEMERAESFATWTPEAKEQVFQFNMITGREPANTRGFAAGDRRAYAREYAEWQVKKGFKPGDVALMQSDYKSGDMSLKNMTKQEAPMQAFVGNINKQIDKIQELYSNNDRLGVRLIDLPVRELKIRAKGSGDEAVKASYLLEISNEIGKLSSGSSASIQQLSDTQQKQWAKIHDPNLSLKEIMKVVNATREQANMRLSSWQEAKQIVRENIKGLGGATSANADYKVGGLYQGKKILGINRDTKQLNVEGLGVVSY